MFNSDYKNKLIFIVFTIMMVVSMTSDDKIDMRLYVKVRPYKKSKGKKTYGKWSDKMVLYIN